MVRRTQVSWSPFRRSLNAYGNYILYVTWIRFSHENRCSTMFNKNEIVWQAAISLDRLLTGNKYWLILHFKKIMFVIIMSHKGLRKYVYSRQTYYNQLAKLIFTRSREQVSVYVIHIVTVCIYSLILVFRWLRLFAYISNWIAIVVDSFKARWGCSVVVYLVCTKDLWRNNKYTNIYVCLDIV